MIPRKKPARPFGSVSEEEKARTREKAAQTRADNKALRDAARILRGRETGAVSLGTADAFRAFVLLAFAVVLGGFTLRAFGTLGPRYDALGALFGLAVAVVAFVGGERLTRP